jgi:hypothetical protein
MTIPASSLDAIHDRASLCLFLQDQLGWPVDAEALLRTIGPLVLEEMGARIRIGAIAPFTTSDPFTILLVELDTPFRRSDLREILRKIHEAILAQAEYDGGGRDEIIFVCVTEGYGGFRFVRFEAKAGRQPRISVFGWERGQPDGIDALLELNLFALQMPPMDATGKPDWSQARWNRAWDVERVTREFFREYRAAFEAVERMIAAANPMLDRDWRHFTLRLFNCQMFLQFLSRSDLHSKIERVEVRICKCYPLPSTLYPLLPWADPISAEASDANGAAPIPGTAIERIMTELFARWNFTLFESAPLDIEVAVDPEMLGRMFEALVAGRHELGAYYTPRAIVAFMCREALKHYLTTAGVPAEAAATFVDERSVSGFRAKDFEISLAALKRVRIVDPACGSGAYLLGMLHELVELRKLLSNRNRADASSNQYGCKFDIIRSNLYGVDLDEFAVDITRLRLWLALIVESEGQSPQPLPNLEFRIAQGDSLLALDPHNRTRSTLEPILPVESVLQQESFDIVVANPPYLSTKHGFGQENRALLTQIYRTAKGQFDAYALFLERALSLLCDTGCYAYLVPKPILTNRSMSPIRELLNIHNIIAIADPGPVFEAAVEPIILIGHKRGKADASIAIVTHHYFCGSPEGRRCATAAEVRTPAGAWNIATSSANDRLRASVSGLPRLGDLFEVRRGVECGKKSASIRQRPGAGAYPLLRGQDLDRFTVRFANYYLMRDHDERIVKPKQLYAAPKLIIRRVANRLIAAVDEQGFHVLNTIYVARARETAKISLEYVCALLNSRMMNDYFQALFVNDDRLFPYIRKEQIDQLPIPLPMPQDEARIVALVRQISGATPEQSTEIQSEIEQLVQQVFDSPANSR